MRFYIEDKHNRKFKESRIVPLCSTLRQALQVHSDIHQDWLVSKIISGFTLEGPPDSFFLIDEEQRALIPVSPRECDRLINSSGIKTEMYFEGIRNGLRHYLLTTLHQAEIPQLLIDFISGHRHMGMEPEFKGSPISWRDSAECLALAIEENVVLPLGLVALST